MIQDLTDKDFYHIESYEDKDYIYDERFYSVLYKIDNDINVDLTKIM